MANVSWSITDVNRMWLYSGFLVLFVYWNICIVPSEGGQTIRYNRTNNNNPLLLKAVICALDNFDQYKGVKFDATTCEGLLADWEAASVTDQQYYYYNVHDVVYTFPPSTNETVRAPGGFAEGLPVDIYFTTNGSQALDTIYIRYLNETFHDKLILTAAIQESQLALTVFTNNTWSKKFKMMNPFGPLSVPLKISIVYSKQIEVYLDDTKVYGFDPKGRFDMTYVRFDSSYARGNKIAFSFREREK